MMDNAEEVMQMLEEFAKMKPQLIPRELDEYLGYVAKTGNPVFKWSLIKQLFREKMINVINEFYEDTLTIDLPPCPNVDVFNYERMKSGLLERLDAFHGAPFTVQRLCELLTNPRKEYNRADKFMRAIEKNILVVSTREPEPGRYSEVDCESTQECSVNGIQETTDALDATFTCNALGSVPVTSTHSLEMADTINMNTVNNDSLPVPLEGDNEVSSDTDELNNDRSLVNNKEHEQEEKPEESTINQVSIMDEEHDTSTVTSSNISGPIDSSVQESVTNDLPPELPDAVISTSQDFREPEVTESSDVCNDLEPIKENSESEPIVQPTETESFSSVITNPVDTSEMNEALPTPSIEPSSAPECDQTGIKDDQFSMDESSEVRTESLQEPVAPQEEDSSSSTEIESQVQTAECDTSEASVDSEKSSEVDEPTPEMDDSSEAPQSSVSNITSEATCDVESDLAQASELTPSDSEVLPTNSVPEEQPPQTDLPESAIGPAVPVPDCQSSSEPMEVEEN